VLGPDFAGNHSAVVGSGSDIHVAHVHFDGNRRLLGPQDLVELLRLGPGKTYTVTGCTFSDASGWTHLHMVEPCNGALISGNTVESAVRPHDAAGHNTDGLSIACATSTVEDNSINDISGVGIVYYGGPGTIIRNNTIIETTTSAFSGINVGDAVRLDHTGVIIEQNTIRAIGSSYFHIGISAGLHAWRQKNISGVTVRRNAISGQIRYGLAVDGCIDCVIQDNQITDWRPLVNIPGCPPAAAYVASVANRHAGGTLQPGFTDVTIDGCLGAPLP
jgi:parallel beta-helix repeat protein